jgi:lipopolysaccharide/colanic/teichoic acid biosynthesis glycosyltransferase
LHARVIAAHHYSVLQEPRFAWVVVLAALILTASYAVGLSEQGLSPGERLLRSFGAVGISIVVVSLIQAVGRQPILPRFVLFVCVVAAPPLQALFSVANERSRVQRSEQERVVAVLGAEEEDRLRQDLAGALERPAVLRAALRPKAALATDSDEQPLITLATEHSATLLVLDREAQSSDEVVSQAAELHRRGVRIRTLSLFYDEWIGKLPISELERIALLFDINEIHRPVYARLKRFLDVSFSLVGMVLLALVTPLVFVGDAFANRGPVFYRQERVGKDGTIFTILKFRTMTPGLAASDWTTEDDPRLTALGQVMRRLHVDELPQVWNVLRRDLSIVGPRPEQPRYVARLAQEIPFYDTRHLVRPGITGWAQVKYDYGATEIDALEKLQFEFFYLRHQSLALDMRIVGRTLRSVVGLRGR